MMEVHAKVTQLDLNSGRDDLSFLLRTINTSFTFILYSKIALGRPGSALLLLSIPSFHLPNNRVQQVSAPGRWMLNVSKNTPRISKYVT